MKKVQLFILLFVPFLTSASQVGGGFKTSHYLNAYDGGNLVLLYAYNDEVMGSEAFSDWEHYLHDFKKNHIKELVTDRITTVDIVGVDGVVVVSATEFTLFMKKGFPSYFYEGLIVEPQVYQAVLRSYSNLELRSMDRAFMPKKVSYDILKGRFELNP